MRKQAFGLLATLLLTAGCNVNLDFLGKPELQEVVLVKSPAKEKILVVDVQGMIGGLSLDNPLSRDGNTVSHLYSRLRKATEDDRVRGVILKIDTPGGDVTSSDILYREILSSRKRPACPSSG